MSYVKPFLRRAARRRPPDGNDETSRGQGQVEGESGGFKKCLTTFDLVSLGVGSCCGAGMYLATGLVSKGAGFGAILSFVLAGFGSLLSGLCYAELAALCPRTSGSAYMYSYVTVGELLAFVIGWGLLMEYAIGTAASAVALSAAVDTMSNFSYGKLMASYSGAFMGRPYFDVIALVVCLTLTVILTSGVKISATINTILNCVNGIVFLFFVGCSIRLAKMDISTYDSFFPKGISGVIKEIPTAYFAFIGFDIVASTGEEAKDPTKSIPKSIWVSVLINTVAYIAISICLNSVSPHFALNAKSAMLDMLGKAGWTEAQYIVSVGAVCALFAATFGSLFPLPRVLYAMAKDGLIWRPLGYLCPTRKTPKFATIVSGCIAAVVSVTLDISILIELVLMGTLLAYVLVAVCVILKRYTFEVDIPPKELSSANREHVDIPLLDEIGSKSAPTVSMLKKLLTLLRRPIPPGDSLSGGEIALIMVILLTAETCASLILAVCASTLGEVWVYPFLSFFLLVIVVMCLILLRLPQNTVASGFRAPLVPLLPVLVTFFNIYLMVSLGRTTWCLFSAWMFIGLIVYVYFSHKNKPGLDEVPLLEDTT